MAERGLSRHRKAQARRPTKYGVHGNVCPCRRPSRLVTTHALGGRTIRGASEQRIVRDPVRYNLHARCPFAPAAAQACCSARAPKVGAIWRCRKLAEQKRIQRPGPFQGRAWVDRLENFGGEREV
jgi:hypothetical protein